ncbi:AbrB/MazE/SpoVT family DNA-binding domain-containing protein [Tardiphaga alba]|uniref:AbrB/MazE/SpoVT family DNA-binding domain-containing protein n=1 Tax=Tardiphaga alba TaxID=340268 RepID=A0ABX8A850_9BRAD|nr:AbrB/MazE/SpoVT family DNA-binding domain-containing protein [Tardiphaga alba]QUS39632.1 AbrB/MazE/SpoVT family DNA-binding domain-containing protein [Tardiphaga alba]
MASRPANLTTLVSTKGQVILPKAIRDQRNWPVGTRLTVEETPEGVLLKAAPLFPATTIDEVVGILRYKGKPLSLEEMDAALSAEAKRRARR